MIDGLRRLASQFFAQRVKVARRRQLQEHSPNPGRRRDKRLESGPIDRQWPGNISSGRKLQTNWNYFHSDRTWPENNFLEELLAWSQKFKPNTLYVGVGPGKTKRNLRFLSKFNHNTVRWFQASFRRVLGVLVTWWRLVNFAKSKKKTKNHYKNHKIPPSHEHS